MNIDTNINFIEILTILENEKILPSAKEWINLRYIRNSLSHEYPDECEETIDTINEIFEKITFLEKIYQNIDNFYKKVKELDENSNNK
jgi:predicted adenine nucleotide alpha hydrolase (AANH) superfamily ATPase